MLWGVLLLSFHKAKEINRLPGVARGVPQITVRSGQPTANSTWTGERTMQNSIRNWWTALSLGAIAALALQAAPPAQLPAVPEPAAFTQEKTEEIAGKVKSVNMDAKTLECEGADRQIQVTSATKFGGGLTLADLKAGDEVRIVGIAKPDGHFEAREIHRKG
jgi:hypothetical protein